MKGGGVFVAVLALLAVSAPAVRGERDVLIIVDVSTWLNFNTWNSNLFPAIQQFLTSGSVQSYAFAASSFSDQGWMGTSSASTGSVSSDFSAITQQWQQGWNVNNNNFVSFTISSARNSGSDYWARNVVLISSFSSATSFWSSNEYAIVLSALNDYWSVANINGGRLLLIQISNGDGVVPEAQALVGSSGYSNAYSTIQGFTGQAFRADYNTLISSVGPQTPPPDINSPDHPNTGCVEFADVIFVIDSSNSILAAGGGLDTFWIMQLDFISRIIERVEVGQDLIRIGLVVFGDNVVVEQELRSTGNDNDAQAAQVAKVKSLTYRGGLTATSDAIAEARNMYLRSPRNVPRIMILITDGVPNSVNNTIFQASIAKQQENIIIATVGVNLASDDNNAQSAENVLREVASRAELFTFIRNFNTLLGRVNEVYTNAFCRIKFCQILDSADVLFVFPLNDAALLDSAKEFAIDIINTMVLDDGSSASGTRVAIMTMDNNIEILYRLDTNIRSNPKDPLISLINSLGPSNTQANIIDEALSQARESIFIPNGDRASARNLMILFAGLVSARDPSGIAEVLRDENDVTIFPIQVTNENNPQLEQQLQSIESVEPIEGGVRLYRQITVGSLVDMTFSYMKAACAVMEWSQVETEDELKGPIGDTGDPGPQGDQGFVGQKGEQGREGEKGNQGNPGFPAGEGQKGDRGAQGNQGEKGNIGPSAGIGQKGDLGISGGPGTPGIDGFDGQKGEPGVPGSPGPKGFRGNGLSGNPGSKGDQGENGNPGFNGIPGQKGQPGSFGQKGESGAEGLKGFPGNPGLPGADGPPGPKGIKGRPGSPGVALKGRQGDKGNPGSPGINGNPGFQGSVGLTGENGEPGFNGFPGAKGQKGSPGLNGNPGVPGGAGQKGNRGIPGVGQPGDTGEKGQPGDRGIQGLSGDPGTNGFPGIKGQPGDQGFRGNPGLNGDTGSFGAKGIKGIKGRAGLGGDPGFGLPGNPGTKGFPGNPGNNGSPGFFGPNGRQGPPGEQGPRGSRGNQGGAGEPGDKGAPGLGGARGENGIPGQPGIGQDGDRGEAGIPGFDGGAGIDGLNGQPGFNGQKGLKGLRGDNGLPGNPGQNGNPGNPGIKGSAGGQGEKGDPGNNGFGPQGDTGDPGLPGQKGSPGFPGQNGIKGQKGNRGNNGNPGGNGIKGIKGSFGDQGDNGGVNLKGFQGPSGRDGFQGIKGLAGQNGFNGQQGLQGLRGIQGIQGAQGDRGDTGFALPGNPGVDGDIGPRGPTGPAGSSTSGYVDQCKIDNGGCQHLCVSLFFSYYCACHPGYTLRQMEPAPFCPDVPRPGFNGAGVDIVAGEAGSNGGPVPNYPTADVVFVVDTSMRDRFSDITRFISEVIGRLSVIEGNTRFAVVYFDSTASHFFTFNQYNSISQLQEEIKLLQASGRTPANIANGLTYALNFVQERQYGARPEVNNKLVVAFTMGNDQLDRTEARDAVSQLRSNTPQIGLVMVAIGSVDVQYIRNTLQTPVVSMGGLDELGSNVDALVEEMRVAVGIERDLVDPPTPAGNCANRLDIAFLIDGSSSLTEQNQNRNFKYVLYFLENMVTKLGVSYSGVRVSFVVFSNYASVRMKLDQTWDLNHAIRVIKKLPYIGGDTNIAYALRAAREVVFTSQNGDRFDANNLAVLISDGRDNVNENELAREAQLLKSTGADVICIGVTQNADMAQLQTIATREEYAVQVESYSALNQLGDIITQQNLCTTQGLFPRADIAIVIDTSDNVDGSFTQNMGIVYQLLNNFRFGGSSDVRIGIVAYGRTVQIVQMLDTNVEDVIERIRTSVSQLQSTEPSVEAAVDVLLEDFFTEANGDRIEAPNIAVFLASGGVSVSSYQASAEKARNNGVAIVAVGVSFDADLFFLQALAYRPELAMALNSYNQILSQMDTIARSARIAVGMVYVPHWRPTFPRNQLCYDTVIHGIQCFCWDNRESLNSTRCINIDECSQNNGGCSHHCVDTEGSYLCMCPEGMTLGVDKHTCQDVNECDASPCHGNAQCLNVQGGYYCLNDGPFAANQLGAAGLTTGVTTNSLVGATVGTAVGTIILMLVVAIVVRTVRRKQERQDSGHDNAGFSGNTNATMKASTGAFDTVSVGASTLADVDSLSSFRT